MHAYLTAVTRFVIGPAVVRETNESCDMMREFPKAVVLQAMRQTVARLVVAERNTIREWTKLVSRCGMRDGETRYCSKLVARDVIMDGAMRAWTKKRKGAGGNVEEAHSDGAWQQDVGVQRDGTERCDAGLQRNGTERRDEDAQRDGTARCDASAQCDVASRRESGRHRDVAGGA